MGMLREEDILFLRGNDGELLPQTVDLEALKDNEGNCPSVRVIPMTRGELQEINNKMREVKDNALAAEVDIDMVVRHLVEPKLTKEQLSKYGKIKFVNAIAIAIMSLSSGLSQDELLGKNRKQQAAEVNSFLSQKE